MIAEWITSLGAAGGTALLEAAATDVWQSARVRMVALFRRGGRRREKLVSSWLDETGAEIEAAPADQRNQIRERLASVWSSRLADLLTEYPDAGEELRAWVREVRLQLPVTQQPSVNTYVAKGHATQYNAPAGSITVHNHQDALPQ